MTEAQAAEIISLLNVIMWMLTPITAGAVALIIIGVIKAWNMPDQR